MPMGHMEVDNLAVLMLALAATVVYVLKRPDERRVTPMGRAIRRTMPVLIVSEAAVALANLAHLHGMLMDWLLISAMIGCGIGLIYPLRVVRNQ